MDSAAVPANHEAAIAEAGGDHGILDYDVLIAGAGLVGLSLAPALAAAGRSVAVADRAVVTSPPAATGDDDWDTRVYAISPGSVAFLTAIGVWQALPADRISSVEAMVVEGDAGAQLHFSAYELGERALAWIVEERTLKAGLVARLATAGVALHAPCAFDSLAFAPRACVLQCGGDKLRARLVVGADGLRSNVRQMAGIVAATKPYGQTAVVANFGCERAHLGRAFQWFHDDGGVLAWLPLPGRRVSMVWSAPHALAHELLALPADALAARVAARGRHCLGAFETITAAVGFPLQLSTLATTVAHRIALVGDAAHGIHPLAGQGVNLGFGDAEALAAVLRDSGPVTDPGEPLLLERFARQRKAPVLAMQYVTDGLARLFGASLPLLRTARNWGMTAVDRLPPAKRVLAQSALR
jgi:2-octaprenyl-6-methoxyphenol hydroxylase